MISIGAALCTHTFPYLVKNLLEIVKKIALVKRAK